MKNRRMIQCLSIVNRKNISRQTIDGIEHIIVSSYTLPDDVVMNDVLYPAAEIAKGYQTLERTLAPVEHPTNAAGEYISATDPEAINNFYAGAYNINVSRENGRVHIEKHVNVVEAKKTDRGKRLLDRIEELETNEKPRPIHTSVGVFLTLETLKSPRKNSAGDQYTMIGKDFVFDHDAILLDSVGAATPAQGVGMAVNAEGLKFKVDRVSVPNAIKAATGLPLADSGRTWSKSSALRRVKAKIGATDTPNATYARYHLWYDASQSENFGAYKLPFVDIVDGEAKAIPSALRNAAARLNQTDGPSDAEKTRIRNIIDGYLNKLRANQEGMPYSEILEKLEMQIKNTVAAEWMYIVDIYPDRVIFETNMGYFQAPYTMSDDTITLAGIPIRVDKTVEYQPKVNQKKGDELMKQLILNALAAAGISTDGLSDEDLLAAYNELQVKGNDGSDGNDSDDSGRETDDASAAIVNAITPLKEQIEALQAVITAKSDKEKDDLVKSVVNSKKYPGITEDAAKLLPLETLKEMSANCTEAHGVPFTTNVDTNNDFAAPAEMPE